MILGALSEAGGEQYLTRQANENPGAFMTLLGKILPTQVTGDEGGPVTYTFHWADAALAPEPEPIAEVGDANDAGNTEIAETWAPC
jgi:hypothetical protein